MAFRSTAQVALLAATLLIFAAVPAGAASVHTLDKPGAAWDVSCPTPGQCTVVSNAGAATFNPAAPGTPTTTPLPHAPYEKPCSQPPSGPGTTMCVEEAPSEPAGASAVDCPSATQCTAITGGSSSGYRFVGNDSRAVVTFNPAAPGSPAPYPIFGCADRSGQTCRAMSVVGLECPTASQCTIAATVVPGSVGAGQENSRYSEILTFDPANPADSMTRAQLPGEMVLSDLSCATAARCTVITTCTATPDKGCDANNTAGQQISFDPRSPTTSVAAKIAPFSLTALDCPTATQCTTIANNMDQYSGLLATFDPAGVRPTKGFVNGMAGGSPSLKKIACPAADQCTALGFRTPYGGTFDPTSGKRADLGSFMPTLKDGGVPFGLDCPSTRSCVSVGSASASGLPDAAAQILVFDPTVVKLEKPAGPGGDDGAKNKPSRAETRCLKKAKKIKNMAKRRKAQRKCHARG